MLLIFYCILPFASFCTLRSSARVDATAGHVWDVNASLQQSSPPQPATKLTRVPTHFHHLEPRNEAAVAPGFVANSRIPVSLLLQNTYRPSPHSAPRLKCRAAPRRAPQRPETPESRPLNKSYRIIVYFDIPGPGKPLSLNKSFIITEALSYFVKFYVFLFP